MLRAILVPVLLLTGTYTTAQLNEQRSAFSHADSLRGGIGPERSWWNVLSYDVWVRPDHAERSIRGTTTISFDAVAEGRRMQIDLQQPLVVDSILVDEPAFIDGTISIRQRSLAFERDGDIIWLDLARPMRAGEANTVMLLYHGVPKAAKNPPWDGGWIWRTDSTGTPWMSVACQGLGASVWYPCKDHQSDEPEDGATLRITVPDSLQAIGNGRLVSTWKNTDGTTTWNWHVREPINTYNLVPYIGRYAHWNEIYQGRAGALDCDYGVLAPNEAKAREQFKQAPIMLTCFEDWFGPYPFYKDGYKLVEAPHLGMEHQSAIAYGNNFMNGYRGSDLSGSGHGLEWDFIIIHESGHEWFGNSITTADIADMWVHEGFTNYSETIFTECQQGKEAAEEYVIGLRNKIRNDKPVIGHYGVNEEGSGDMYYKGANLIHMIRHIVGDSAFKAMLLEMNRRFHHKVTTSAEVEDFMINFNERTKSLLNKSIFDQYLRTTQVPVLEWGRYKRRSYARWSNCLPGFTMPVRLNCIDDGTVSCGTAWSSLASGSRVVALQVDRNWYVQDRMMAKRVLKRELSMQRNGTAHPKP
ncbi:MAG TPA: M1 family metallopeptidase [Flavobacteriales bacterium]|nr:M1 family metallopeptidase [Flavobacteriales bacterium]